ncbi:thiazole synthase, partial [Bifidobacteriaceae bacterium NR021]
KAEMITVAIRYSEKAAGILKHIPEGVTILP